MPAGFLVVDVSNSFTKIAVVRKGRLCEGERQPTADLEPSFVRALASRHPMIPVVLASVVPAKTAIFRSIFAGRLLLVHGKARLGFPVDYPKPSEIGADRLANAAAALHFWKPPVVVIDFGTATNFDIVNAAGAFCGGVIAPGLELMTAYLHERTALLPRVRLTEPERGFGRSTIEAIRVGAVHGYRAMIRGLIEKIREELGTTRLTAVATGGQARMVTRGLPEVLCVRPRLTLEGLCILGRRWLGESASGSEDGDRSRKSPPRASVPRPGRKG